MVNTKNGDFMFYYLNMYFIGCFLGYALETTMKTFFNPKMNNGILYGPWIPVYGFGILLSSYVTNKVFKMKISNRSKFIISFLVLFITITLVEQLGGMLIEKAFHKVFWSYKSKKFNIGPYISLEMSLLWSFLSLLFVWELKPLIDVYIKKIPRILTLILLGIQIIDAIFTWLI